MAFFLSSHHDFVAAAVADMAFAGTELVEAGIAGTELVVGTDLAHYTIAGYRFD
jgi:hypothetical protein